MNICTVGGGVSLSETTEKVSGLSSFFRSLNSWMTVHLSGTPSLSYLTGSKKEEEPLKCPFPLSRPLSSGC